MGTTSSGPPAGSLVPPLLCLMDEKPPRRDSLVHSLSKLHGQLSVICPQVVPDFAHLDPVDLGQRGGGWGGGRIPAAAATPPPAARSNGWSRQEHKAAPFAPALLPPAQLF